MNYSQIAILFLQGTLVAFTILLLFKLRKQLGIGTLFACLGLFQFVQVFLSSTVYVSITDNFIISIGSTVFFTASLFAILLIYIKEDASETKRIIYALFIINVLMTILLETFGWNFKDDSTYNPHNLSTKLFDVNARVIFVGALALLLDSLLLIIIFEFISRHVKSLFLRILLTMLFVVSFDTILFSTLAFWEFEKFNSILISGLISKGVFTVFYSLLFYIYLKYFDSKEPFTSLLKLKDVFQTLSYKQKFNDVSQEIKKAEEMYRLLADNSNDLICLHENDSTFKYISPSIKNLLGYDHLELLGTKGFSIIHKDDIKFFKKSIEERVLKKVKNDAFYYRAIHKQGHIIWLECTSSSVFLENKLNYIITSARDISQRIMAKEKIQISLDLLEKSEYSKNEASKMAKIGYWEFDSVNNIVTWSEYIYQIFGLDPKDNPLVRDKYVALFDDKSQVKLAEATESLSKKGVAYDIELKTISLNNKQLWLRIIAQPIFSLQNEIIGRRGVMQNITESKEAQFNIENSKRKVQSSLEQLKNKEYALSESSRIAKIGHWEYNIALEKFFWSDYIYEIYGLAILEEIPSREELVSLYDKESQKILIESTNMLSINRIPYDIELKLINYKQKELWVRMVVHLVFNDKDEIIGRRGVVHNITESKNAQLELERSKEKIQTSLELLTKKEADLHEVSSMAKIGYWHYNFEKSKIVWSDYHHEIFGVDPKGGIPSREKLLSYFDSKSQKMIEEANQKLNAEGTSYDIEVRLINEKNKEVWVRNIVQPMYDTQNKFIGRKGLLQDITEFKFAQIELENSKKEIQSTLNLLEKSEYSKNEASKIAKIGYWEVDKIKDKIIWSENLHNIVGSNPKNGIPKMDVLEKHLSKKYFKIFKEATENLMLKGKPYDIELKLVNLKGNTVWFRNVAQPIYNKQNEIIGRRGVLQDITQQKNSQIELETSKLKSQESLELLAKRKLSMDEASKIARIGYWEHDIVNESIIWSDFMHEIFGSNLKDGIPEQSSIMNNFDNKSKIEFERVTQNLLTKGESYDLELKYNNPKKGEIWIRNVAQPIYNNQNEIIGKRGILQDITDSRKAQQELEFSKSKLETSLELAEKKDYSLKEASKLAKIGYWEYDNIHDILIWSEYVFHIFGFNPKEETPKSKDYFKLLEKESLKRLEKAILILNLKGTPYDIELKLTNLKKEEVWIRNVVHPIYNQQNEVIGRRGVLQNITNSKNAQLELEHKSKKLNELNKALNEAQKLSHVGSWHWNMKTDEAEWSDEMYNIYGVTRESFYPSNANVSKTVFPEDLHKIEAGISSLLIDNMFVPFEFRMIRPSGEIRYLHIVALEKNSNESVFGVTKDITDRKRIEEERLIVEENYRRIFETSAISIWDEDFTLVFKQINELKKLEIPNIIKHLEMYPEVLFSLLENLKVNGVNKSTLKLFKAKSNEDFLNNITDTFTEGTTDVFSKLMESIWNNEKIFTSEVNYKILEGDEFAAIVSIPIPQTEIEQKTVPVSIQSIQSIKEAELEKNKSLKKLNEAQELARVGSWVFNVDSQMSEWSVETFRIWGINPASGVPDFDSFVNLIYVKDREMFLKAANLATNKGIPYNIEFRIELSTGEQKWIRSICKLVLGDNGELISLTGSNQDITEQKLRQKELDTQNKKLFDLNNSLNNAQKLAKLGSWFFYPSTELEEWSEEMYDIWGFDSNSGSPDYKNAISRIHPEDEELFNIVDNRAIKEGISYDIEFRINLPDNIEKTIRSICKPVLGENGEVIYLAGTNQDITEKKLIKRKIEEAEEMYRLLTDNSNDLICLQEPDSTFKYISPSIKNLLGYEQSEFLGKKVFSIVHEEDIEALKYAMENKVFAKLSTEAFSFRIRHKKGHFVWLEFLSSPVLKDNKVSYFVTSARDITQWILAKQEIQEYQTSLQEMTTEMTLIEEKQKKEIASNIHDHLSQSLVISKMKINELKKKPELKEIDEDLKFIETHISEALENSRKITYELSPPVLYQLGIIDALNWMFENVEATHKIKCSINSNVDDIDLSELKSILLYRCLQEVVKNAIKYASATLLTLDIDKSKFGLNIILTDNGNGFDTSKLNNYHGHTGSGFGLFTVQERIKNIQGRFEIASEIKKGTTVNIFIPLSI